MRKENNKSNDTSIVTFQLANYNHRFGPLHQFYSV